MEKGFIKKTITLITATEIGDKWKNPDVKWRELKNTNGDQEEVYVVEEK